MEIRKLTFNGSKRRFYTSFLTSSPSLLSGAATVMNLAGSFYKFNLSAADKKALSQDFRMIGQDMQDVLNRR